MVPAGANVVLRCTLRAGVIFIILISVAQDEDTGPKMFELTRSQMQGEIKAKDPELAQKKALKNKLLARRAKIVEKEGAAAATEAWGAIEPNKVGDLFLKGWVK